MAQGRQNIVAVALTVALGGFLLGFDATVISGVVPFIREYFGLTGVGGDLKLGWAVSSLGWGAMAGNAAAGVLSDRFGRKRVLIATACLFVISALSTSLATSLAASRYRRSAVSAKSETRRTTPNASVHRYRRPLGQIRSACIQASLSLT